MNKSEQIKKAKDFLALHHAPRLLVLPNVWDPLGARVLQDLGFPAVATASSAVSWSLGYDDGQIIDFDTMLDVIGRIATAVDVPVTADVESGYADDLDDLADNIRRVIRTGVVGVNLEDSTHDANPLYPIDDQCDRIRAARAGADLEDFPLVINARIDVFYRAGAEEPRDRLVEETIDRARAYVEAGADCVFPLLVGDIDTLKLMAAEIQAPINVYVSEATAPMTELETAGVRRVSVGPWMLKACTTRFKEIATALKNYESFDVLTKGTISSDEMRRYVSPDFAS